VELCLGWIVKVAIDGVEQVEFGVGVWEARKQRSLLANAAHIDKVCIGEIPIAKLTTHHPLLTPIWRILHDRAHSQTIG